MSIIQKLKGKPSNPLPPHGERMNIAQFACARYFKRPKHYMPVAHLTHPYGTGLSPTAKVLKLTMPLKMLKNVPINKLIEVLTEIQKESSLCDIEINEDKPGIMFRPVSDSGDKSKTRVEPAPKPNNNKRLDPDDLDKFTV